MKPSLLSKLLYYHYYILISTRYAGRLNRDAKLAFLDDLVQHGSGEWLDGKTKRTFLVLWRPLPEWADILYSWAVSNGLKDSVVTVDEMQRGEDVRGTEVEGLPRVVLDKALKVLEGQGRAK